MKEEKFKTINLIKKLIINIDSSLENFPKKDIEIKNKIKTISFDLLEFAYQANVTNRIEEKEKLLEATIAKVKTLDFLINLCYDKQIINGKKYLKFGENIDEIIKYILGWKSSIKRN